MLVHLSVRNIATLAKVDLEIPRGLVVLTGETGAGKSLLVESLRFALGVRVRGGLIREGSDQAEVIAVFQLPLDHPVQDFLESCELHDPESPGQLVLRRVLKTSGRNVFQINGVNQATKTLDPVRALLIDLTSQHAHVRLLDPQHHKEIIDRFPKVRDALIPYQEHYATWSALNADAKALQRQSEHRAERLDYLTFLLGHCDRVEPEENEELELEQRWRRLENAKEIQEHAATAHHVLTSDDGSVEQQTMIASSMISKLDRLDPQMAETFTEQLDQIQDLVRALASDLRGYGESIDFSESSRRQMEARVEELRGLRRRFGCQPEELLDRIRQARVELEDLENYDERSQEALLKAEKAHEELIVLGERLRDERAKAMPTLLGHLHSALTELEMPNAKIKMISTPVEPPTPWGLEELRLLAQTNPGEGFHPLEDIASGGELSRLLLAIKATAKQTDPVLSSVFDEVDSGVSGQAAKAVARLLSELADGGQVLCISHLPQIAAVADVHVHATKEIRAGRTFSNVRPLNDEERLEVVTKLLSGDKSDAARAHARELLAMTN